VTTAFENFMRQYKMTGSEKADGYSDDAFVGLDEHEKEVVFKLLVTELPWSVEWLFFVDREKALAVAKEEEARLRGNPEEHVYMLQQKIVKYAGELNYQMRMIEDYPHYVDRLKARVVSAVNSTPVNKETVEFFKKIIFSEVNGDAVARASRHLLDAIKLPRGSEAEKKNYDRLVSELRNDDVKVKQRALALIRKYEDIILFGA
jgi:hypothetical protein